jgi:PST family polysaccharide transporter
MAGSEGRDLPNARSKLRENIVSLFLLQGSNYILPFAAVPYLVRVLGPADYGLIAFAQALTVYFATAVDYGFNLSATRDVALLRGDKAALAELLGCVLTIKLVFAAAGFVVVAALSIFVAPFDRNPALFMLSYAAVVGSVLFPVWLFQGLESMKLMSWLSIAGRVISVAGIFIFVRHSQDILWAGFFQSSALLFAGVPGLMCLWTQAGVRVGKPQWRHLRKTLSDGWEAFLATASITLFTNTNVFVLGLLAPPEIVGYYAGASKLILALNGLFGPINQAVYPHVTRLFVQSRRAGFQFMRKIIAFQTGLALVSCVVLFVCAGVVVRIVLGPAYGPSTLLLRIMIFLPLFSTLTNILGVQIMMALDMKRPFLQSILLSGVVNLIIIVPLCVHYQAVGAAVAVMLVEILTPVSMFALLVRAGVADEIVFANRQPRLAGL